jgi:hypothetical protein
VFLNVTIDPDSDTAHEGYETGVQLTEQNGISGAQPVKDLGEQATAIFEHQEGPPAVDLYVWSGNAEIEVNFTELPPPTPSRAVLLAGAAAMARDVLADLPR